MAKTSINKSLCVAEYIESLPSVATGWKVIADMATVRNATSFIPFAQGKLSYKTPSIGEVAVLEWAEGRKLASGELDVRPLTNVEVVELIEPREFEGLFLEDEDDIRTVLREGFSVPDYSKVSFMKGQTSLALVIPSKSGYKRAIVLREKGKLNFKNNIDYRKGWSCAFIESKPEDPNRFMERVDIIQVDDMVPISYKYTAQASYVRKFLPKEAAIVNTFVPYSTKDYAPIVLKRVLGMATKSHQLYSGRKLTKADVGDLFDCIEDSLRDESTWIETIRVNDKDTAKQVADGVRAMVPKIREDVMQDNQVLNEVRALLLADEDIHALCIEEGKQLWLSERTEEQKKAQKQLDILNKEIGAAEAKKAAGIKACADMEKRIKDIQAELDTREAAAKNVSGQLTEAVETYRHNIAKLIMDTGCQGGTALPYTEPGASCSGVVSLEKAMLQKALCHNLERFLASDSATGLAIYLEYMIGRGYHLAVPGEYASLIADALSAAQEGSTAAVVVRADEDCTFAEIKRAIQTSNTSVVLVEGVLGCAQDFQVMAIARHCKGKIIVFSIDDAFNMDKISSTVYGRIALVNNREITEVKDSAYPMWMVQGQLKASAFNPIAEWKKFPNAVANELMQAQKEAMGG